MELLTKKNLLAELKELAQDTSVIKVSVSLPSERQWDNTEQTKIRLTNQIKEVKTELEASTALQHDLLSKLEGLETDESFWQQQLEGLMLYVSPQSLEIIQLPTPVEERSYIGKYFDLTQLVNYMFDHIDYYVLALDLKNVRLLQCVNKACRQVGKHVIPNNINELFDFINVPEQLQFHTTGSKKSPLRFHGQGEFKDAKEEDIREFFIEVNEKVTEVITDEETPLILACLDEYYPIYKDISSHVNVADESVKIDAHTASNAQLAKQAWEVAQGFVENKRQKRVEELNDAMGSSRVIVDDLEKIAKEASYGHVEHVFVRKERKDGNNKSLVNFIVVNLLRKGGEVLELKDGDVQGDPDVVALLRHLTS